MIERMGEFNVDSKKKSKEDIARTINTYFSSWERFSLAVRQEVVRVKNIGEYVNNISVAEKLLEGKAEKSDGLYGEIFQDVYQGVEIVRDELEGMIRDAERMEHEEVLRGAGLGLEEDRDGEEEVAI